MPQFSESIPVSTTTQAPSKALPIICLLIAMASLQGGAALAKSLFSEIGAEGVTALRIGFAAIFLCVIYRPWRRPLHLIVWRPILVYGTALGCMNLAFYMSLKTIPLGPAVAIEFSGPLAVAIFYSRRPADLIWLALAIFGLYLLLPFGQLSAGLDITGVLLALFAGVCWAVYIVAGKKAGDANGRMSVPLGSLVAAMFIFPIGLIHAGTGLFSLAILPTALLVGIFSSTLPYSLEMVALTKLPSKTFSTFMSLEPALGAVCGYLFLKEGLTTSQGIAVLCIIVSSIGITSAIGKDRS
ncbi:EamA family transporter [Glaciimonas sp. PCH181]|nr:EamA family transporter [Glaciimonas sp. PCH181]